MWKQSPSRGRLHRAAAILDDRVLHDLTNIDVFWDKAVETTSVGKQDIYEVVVADKQSVAPKGISVRAARPDGDFGMDRDSPADATKASDLAYPLQLSRFADMIGRCRRSNYTVGQQNPLPRA